MARRPTRQRVTQDQIEQLKRNISILHLCADHGIELKRHGTHDHIGKCPFHDDEKPSFIVTPSKNLWHCMGCNKGGSVIDLVMELEGIDFKAAVDKLLTSNGLIHRGTPPPPPAPPTGGQAAEPDLPEEKIQKLLERVTTVYQKTMADVPEGRDYLDKRGITDTGLFARHAAGYCNGRLVEMLPSDGSIKDDLKATGILLKNGHERFTGCVVFPVFDVEGNITTLYGRYTEDGHKKHVFLSGRPTGLWNAGIIKTYSEVILVESVIDALSVETAGYPNVIAIQGTNGLGKRDIQLLEEYGVTKITLLLDGDDAGQQAAERLKEKLAGLDCEVRFLPDNHDPNSYLLDAGPEKLRSILSADLPSEKHSAGEPGPDPAVKRADDGNGQAPALLQGGLSVSYGPRKYHVMGIDKSPRRLKGTVRVEYAGKLHIDTLDFYSARSRRLLAQDLCRIFEETPETIEADITRLMRACEKAPTDKPGQAPAEAPLIQISARDRIEAERFGKAPDLIDKILADFETCGLVGEEHNKLLGYVAMTSRKREEPISMLVLSSSGAGKTALQDAVCAFCPPEDMVKVTSLSGKALFYKEQHSLKNKVLALEEGDGAEEASYAIRSLISSGVLVSESTIKDLTTGRLTTMENRVEGPTPVFYTTTNPNVDPETKSRFFVTSIDESPEQTRRILSFQRQRHREDGTTDTHDIDAVLKRHRNFQRLLKPLAVKNPYADRLTYGDDRLQGRRDQPKYLRLIKAIAFLRQMLKPLLHDRTNGHAVAYIEADHEDIRIANKLAHEILGRSLDELSRPARALLMLLDELIEKAVERLKKENPDHAPQRTHIRFTRREIREFTGWTNSRVHRYLKELVDLEYVLIDSGRNGTLCRYRLAYEGQGKNGERFMLGLTDPDKLDDPSSPEASQDNGKDG